MKLLNYEDLKPWQRDNSYILQGYRGELISYWKCFQSIFLYFHNESINIHTHLGGSLVSLISLIYLLPKGTSTASQNLLDTLAFALFFLSAFTCLGFSCLFHTFTAHSQPISQRFNRLDYIGIAFLIHGTFVALSRFAWACDPLLQYFYWALITIAASGAIAMTVSTHGNPSLRRQRTYWFIGLGSSAIFPIAHMLIRDGYQATSDAFTLNYLALGGLLYIIGALLYAERCPERFKPGRFDYLGASHQLFHVAILAAAYCHYCGIEGSYRFRSSGNGVCPL